MTGLHIPADLPDDVLGAALAYAAAGWFVGPLKPGSKHPGSVLGTGWPDKTSRDPQVIAAWFAGTACGLFLDVGRSGAVAFDVDHPDRLPDDLHEVLKAGSAPFQSTRTNEDGRGHHVFRVDRPVGNSTRSFPGGWGEIRSHHAVIVVAPTVHADEAEGGRYRWVRTGPVPMLPAELAERLAEPQVRHLANLGLADLLPLADLDPCPRMSSRGAALLAELASGASRHEVLTGGLVDLIRFGTEHPGVAVELGRVRDAFLLSVTTDTGRAVRSMPEAEREWDRLLRGALAIVGADAGPRFEEDVCIVASDPPWHPGDPLPTRSPSADRERGPTTSSGPGTTDNEAGEEPIIIVDTFERDVALRVRELEVTAEARRRVAAVGRPEIPDTDSLDDLLAEPDEPVTYRVDRLWPKGGTMLLAAAAKSGKTVLTANLIRSLVDNEPFLGTFNVEPVAGNVVLIDNEMDRAMLRRWYRDLGIVNTARVKVISLHGRAGAFDVLDPEVRADWAKRLVKLDAGIVFLDCLRPVIDALGLSEDKDAGRVVLGFNSLLVEANVREGGIAHHMGHGGERPRGDSSIRGHIVAEWHLLRQSEDGREPTQDAARFLSARGRDVDLYEGQLEYDNDRRLLTFKNGSRAKVKRDKKTEDALPDILVTLFESESALSYNELVRTTVANTEHARDPVRQAISLGVEKGRILVEPGPGGKHLHSLNPSERASVRDYAATVRPHAVSGRAECAAGPIGAARPHSARLDVEESGSAQSGAEPCRVCGSPLLHLDSVAAGICAKRDQEHDNARNEKGEQE